MLEVDVAVVVLVTVGFVNVDLVLGHVESVVMSELGTRAFLWILRRGRFRACGGMIEASTSTA